MSPFWTVNLLVWLAVLAYATPAAWTAVFRRNSARHGDPRRLATWLIALLFVGQAARWLFIPNDVDVWRALYCAGAFTGLFTLRLMIAYGRGDIIGGDPDG